MEFTRMRLSVDEGVARLVFTEAARGNPIDARFCAELSEAAVQVSDDAAVRCLLVSAEGRAFSYGGDISAMVADLDGGPANIRRWTTTLHSAVSRFQRMDAPIVAAVHGVCAGGMAGFVAGADLLVATHDARFASAYAGIGFSSDAGSSVMYARRMGPARARRFLLLNETMDAADALACGLVDEVVAADVLVAHAEALAARLAAGPTRAYGEIRRLFASVGDQPLETQLELEALALARSVGTQDAREGLTAFAARRLPSFRGA